MAKMLPTDKKIQVIAALAEGSAIRSIERMTGIHRDTIMRLGVKVGQGCARLMDEKMQELSCGRPITNFVKRHNTLRCTPAMAAGVTSSFWSVGELVEATA